MSKLSWVLLALFGQVSAGDYRFGLSGSEDSTVCTDGRLIKAYHYAWAVVSNGVPKDPALLPLPFIYICTTNLAFSSEIMGQKLQGLPLRRGITCYQEGCDLQKLILSLKKKFLNGFDHRRAQPSGFFIIHERADGSCAAAFYETQNEKLLLVHEIAGIAQVEDKKRLLNDGLRALTLQSSASKEPTSLWRLLVDGQLALKKQ